MVAIEIRDLRKSYGSVAALKGISFKVRKGDFFGFIGPNGAGKTTTIKAITGLVRFQGSVKVFGRDVVNDYRNARRLIGLAPQEFNFDRFLTVEECLFYTAGYYGIKKRESRKRTERMLRQFGLWEKRKERTEALSGGMKRRLMIARAIIHSPKLLILDEPTAGVDVHLRRELWEMLTTLNNEGVTILLTTHYIEEVEKLATTVGIIHEGKLLAFDKKTRLMEDLSNQTLKLRTDKRVDLSVIPGNRFRVAEKDGTLCVTGKGIRKKAAEIIRNVEETGARVLEVDIVNESLESVFLRLTGGSQK